MTCRDFMKYLVYIEHCAENLQFYLWYKDYVERFGQLPKSERALSPECALPAISEGQVGQVPNLNKPKDRNLEKSSAQRFFQHTFASLGSRSFKEGLPGISPPGFSPGSSHNNPFDTPLRIPKVGDIAPFSSSEGASPSLRDIKHKNVATKAFEGVDLKWQPCMLARSHLTGPFAHRFVQSLSSRFVTRSPASSPSTLPKAPRGSSMFRPRAVPLPSELLLRQLIPRRCARSSSTSEIA